MGTMVMEALMRFQPMSGVHILMGMVMTMRAMKLMIERFYIGEVPGVANNDTTYLDGSKTPTEMGFYIQDKMEFDDLVVNVGVRD